MNKRNRIFLGILLVYVLGVAFLLYRISTDLDPRYRESTEESLVETAHLFASLIEQNLHDGAIDTRPLAPLFRSAYGRDLNATIFGFAKARVELRLYVTDRKGRVLFDSTGRQEGKDFSDWRDVALSLRGEYGARTTRDIPDDESTSVMYVGAPIRDNNGIVGVVTVGKPVASFGQYVEAARRKIVLVGAGSVLAVLLLAIIVSIWLVRPIGLISDYSRYLAQQRRDGRLSLRHMLRRLRGDLSAAYHEMRDTLAGRSYVQEYVQTLTHELKSPLSAIRGAAELLHESLPEDTRQRFLDNITRESQRIQELVDRMLELAALERRRSLDLKGPVDLRALADEVAHAASPQATTRHVRIHIAPGAPVQVEGDAFLLRRALGNLVDNAVDFSPEAGEVLIDLSSQARQVQITVRDHGPGIPDYATEKVFQKFYSLPRPHSQKKGTGLGLSFVQEIAALHGGRISLGNQSGGGAVAVLTLPL